MAEIYGPLEIAGPKGARTGTWRMVVHSDEASKPLYHPLCNHAHASPQEASECPVAKDATDRAFSRGKYRPASTGVPRFKAGEQVYSREHGDVYTVHRVVKDMTTGAIEYEVSLNWTPDHRYMTPGTTLLTRAEYEAHQATVERDEE